MKKYSADYFRDKFEILYKKLLNKENFESEVKKLRLNLNIPEDGFTNHLEVAEYFMKRLTKSEKEVMTSLCFLEQYEMKNGRIDEEQMRQVIKEFDKKFKDNFVPMIILISFGMHLEDHNNFFTKDKLLSYGKKNSELFKPIKKLFDKYMAVDLLDAHIIMHFVEKFVFMGKNGVNEYIKGKIACSNCRYIGVNHFSPVRANMKGQDFGPFSEKYLFNDNTVKLLSGHFDSVFLIIKPYATKEQVMQYVDDNWDDLKEHIIEKNTFYKQFDVHPAVIRESDDEKNRLVYELNKLSKKDLLKRYKGEKDFNHKGVYKESIISAILDEEYEIKMSTDAIKKSASRYSKSTKVKIMPKDIRDI
jgi:hypothetical protein